MRKILWTIPIWFFLAMGLAQAIPLYQDNTTSVANGTAYLADRNYGFQINWTDSNLGAFDNATFWTDINVTGGANFTASNDTASGKQIWYINFTDIPAGTYHYIWYGINTTGAENKTDNMTYVITKATPSIPVIEVNVTYMNFNESFKLTVNATKGARVTATIVNATDTINYTLSYVSGSPTNYTYEFTKAELGDSQSAVARINITYVYTDGNNFTMTTNTSTLYVDYGKTNSLTVTAPSEADTGKSITIKTNYTTIETPGTIIYQNCTVSFGGNTYDMDYSSGYQQVTFTNPETDTGSDPYTVTCSNSSYQTQTATGSIKTFGAGGGGGGGVTTTTPTTIPTAPKCGNGVCDEGEYLWSCWRDCNPFKGQKLEKEEIKEIIEEKKTFSVSNVVANVPEVIRIDDPDTGMRQIQITVKNPANTITITVTKLQDKPASVTHEITGKVYKYIEINTDVPEEEITEAKIQFQVEKSWLEENNIDKSSIVLNRYDNGWQKLTTRQINEDENLIYYEADSPGFSTFAITAEKQELNPIMLLILIGIGLYILKRM